MKTIKHTQELYLIEKNLIPTIEILQLTFAIFAVLQVSSHPSMYSSIQFIFDASQSKLQTSVPFCRRIINYSSIFSVCLF